MAIVMDAEILATALRVLRGVIPTRTPIPIHESVHVEAREGRVRLSAADIELAGTADLPAEVGSPVSLCLPPSAIDRLTRQKQGRVSVSCAGAATIVQIERAAYTYEAPEAAEFPAPRSLTQTDWSGRFDLAALRKMVRLTEFVVSGDSTRYALTGLFIDARKSMLHLVATDGKRLAAATRTIGCATDSTASAIVPPGVLTLLDGLKGMDAPEEAHLLIGRATIGESDEPIVEFSAGAYRFVSRTIEGTFPDWETVIPTDRDRLAEFDIKPLREAVARLLPLRQKYRSGSEAVCLAFAPRRPCTIEYRSDQERGRSSERLDFTGEPTTVGCNPDFLLEALDALLAAGAARVRLKLKDSATAVILESEQVDGYRHVMMPLQVPWMSEVGGEAYLAVAVQPGTWVTHQTGNIGNTSGPHAFSFSRLGWAADPSANSVCRRAS